MILVLFMILSQKYKILSKKLGYMFLLYLILKNFFGQILAAH